MELKKAIQSPAFRDIMIFSGLIGAAFVLSAVFNVDATFASLISGDDAPSAISEATGGEGDLRELVKTILYYFLGFLGFVATVMVIYGGVLYVTSAGNEENVQKAKKILLYAVVGIIIILVSFALVRTVLGAGMSGGTTTTVGMIGL